MAGDGSDEENDEEVTSEEDSNGSDGSDNDSDNSNNSDADSDGDNDDDDSKRNSESKHVQFKETPLDNIREVYNEIDGISSSIDSFLYKLNGTPLTTTTTTTTFQNSNPYLYRNQNQFSNPYQQQQQQHHQQRNQQYSFQGENLPTNPPPTIDPSVHHSISLASNVSRFPNAPTTQQHSQFQSEYGSSNNQNKFFYNQNSMASASKTLPFRQPNSLAAQTSSAAVAQYQATLKANQSNQPHKQLVDQNRMQSPSHSITAENIRPAFAPTEINQSRNQQEVLDPSNQQGRESKFNYYGSYRFQSDAAAAATKLPSPNLPQLGNNALFAGYLQQKQAQQINDNTVSTSFTRKSEKQDSTQPQQRQSLPPQPATIEQGEFSKKKSITNDQLTQKSLAQLNLSSSKNAFEVSPQNRNSSRPSYYENPESPDKSNNTSFTQNLPQNFKDLYKNRPKRGTQKIPNYF